MQRFERAHALSGKVTCSNGIGGIHPRTPDFVCDIRVAPTVCDEYEANRTTGHWVITLHRRGVECVLPA